MTRKGLLAPGVSFVGCWQRWCVYSASTWRLLLVLTAILDMARTAPNGVVNALAVLVDRQREHKFDRASATAERKCQQIDKTADQ